MRPNKESYIFIGVDPGQNGAICVMNTTNGNIVESCRTFKMPMTMSDVQGKKMFDYKSLSMEFISLKHNYRENVRWYIENVHSMPKQGVASSFKFGYNFGYICGFINTMGWTYNLVTPQSWKKNMIKDQDRGSKKASVVVANEIYGILHGILKPTETDRADAILIAEYGRLCFLGGV